MGMQIDLQAGYRQNIDLGKGYGYLIPQLGFDYKLASRGQLVFATNFRAHLNLGNDYQFYQAASLGAKTGLRGYRNERFAGKSAYAQSTDLRWNFNYLKTGLLPIHIGFFVGFDYGRVQIGDGYVLSSTFNDDNWNTSFGGGFLLNMADLLSFNINAFNSVDGLRLGFKFGFIF